ncbi:hypothetical protein ANCCAN_17411 [Ancylostoma caninum]|uniref:SCP domain-containing protein n=1 Tax=Ancylostoma caninum TaxID=29170 RepID=A0A368FWY2_ANCCA|nr:hypothetical protein ANCCAN_17411 [Ancylostoma caninum]
MHQSTGSQRLSLPNPHISNFAKMMWDSHTHVGCAVVKCLFFTNVVCHYRPADARPGRLRNTIYTMGPNCSQCKTVCVDGLCS